MFLFTLLTSFELGFASLNSFLKSSLQTDHKLNKNTQTEPQHHEQNTLIKEALQEDKESRGRTLGHVRILGLFPFLDFSPFSIWFFGFRFLPAQFQKNNSMRSLCQNVHKQIEETEKRRNGNFTSRAS